jgi:hypothetical protein
MKRILLINRKDGWGIYLGSAMGMGFWTLMDCVGQPSAVTFPSEISARDYVRTWKPAVDPDSFEYFRIDCAEEYASMDELESFGLKELMGDMRKQAERFAHGDYI